jgi:hypothetical protein
LNGEAGAIAAIGPVGLRRNRATGIPRRTATHWKTLTLLVEPLDAARAGLHHDADPGFKRAGAQAAAIVLAHCAETGRSYWGWTEWEWARLCGSSAAQFLAARTLPTERTVRPFLVALAYLLGGFTSFQHLGNFNRLHLAWSSAKTPSKHRSARPAGFSISGLPGSAAHPAPAAWHVQPGPADQPQPPAGGPDHRGIRGAAFPPGQRRALPGDDLRTAAGVRLAGLL